MQIHHTRDVRCHHSFAPPCDTVCSTFLQVGLCLNKELKAPNDDNGDDNLNNNHNNHSCRHHQFNQSINQSINQNKINSIVNWSKALLDQSRSVNVTYK